MRSLPTLRRLSLFVSPLRAPTSIRARALSCAPPNKVARSLLPLPTRASAQINVHAHMHMRQVYVLAFLGRGALPWDVDGIQDFAWYTRILVRVYVYCVCVCVCTYMHVCARVCVNTLHLCTHTHIHV